MAKAGTLDEVVGYSERGVPMVECPSCGPVIAVSRDSSDGDAAYCRVCGSKHRLHSRGDSFVVEPMSETATAEELRPRAEVNSIDELVRRAPSAIDI